VEFPTRGTPEVFAASDISSVIALAKAENGSKQTRADERIRRRQFAHIMRVVLKTLAFIGISESGGKDSLSPSHLRLSSPFFLALPRFSSLGVCCQKGGAGTPPFLATTLDDSRSLNPWRQVGTEPSRFRLTRLARQHHIFADARRCSDLLAQRSGPVRHHGDRCRHGPFRGAVDEETLPVGTDNVFDAGVRREP
jgi:hypothetical protein